MSEDEIIEDLRQTCAEQTEELAKQAKVIAQLQNELKLVHEERRLALNRLFKRSSEHMNTAQEAMVFDEAEAVSLTTAPEETIEEVVVKRKKKTGKRQEDVAGLEKRDIEYPASEEQQICPCCGEKMHLVDWQVKQEVEYIPAKAVLVNHKQPVYACRDCQENGEDAPIHTILTMPELAFPKSLASPSLVSHIITQKFVMAAPLYRQEQNMIGLGIIFSRQTLANWMIRAATLLQPLYNRMHQILLEGDIIHADETTLQVLNEPGRAATTAYSVQSEQ